MRHDFEQQLSKYKTLVWQEIKKHLPNKQPKKHYQMVAEYPIRQGKYLRPALLLLSNEFYGGLPKQAIQTAAIIQLAEDWLLIHDDVEDHSIQRRSTPTVYRPSLNNVYGDELAINTGDALHILMWKALGQNTYQLGPKTGWLVFNKVNDILLTTTEGQFLELSWIRSGKFNISESEYLAMVYKKSVYYSILGPIQLGAILAGVASKKDLKQIASWAVPLGYNFQLTDDLLNLTSESHIIGKEKAGDIWEGKRTLAVIHLLNSCSSFERNAIISIYSKKRSEKTAEEINYVLSLMKTHGSIDYLSKLAADYAKKCRQTFIKYAEKLNHSPQPLSGAIDFICSRKH